MRQAFQRKPVQPAAQAKSKPKAFPAPTKGWVSAQNLAAARPGTALVLENWFPTRTSIRLRFGSLKKATIGAPVISMMSYIGTSKKLFACSATAIFNVTAPADPNVAPAADVSSLTGGYFSFLNFATGGGNFLVAVNGHDSMRQYDGTSWATITAVSSPIAITGVVTSKLSYVWAYRKRMFFIEGGTMRAWALPVNSLGGAAIQIDLSGVFQRGGSLLFGATWSQDSGDGLDDKCVFVTDQGEVAVYQGSDPSDPTDWSLVGRYDMPAPMGSRSSINAGGDLVIATTQGAVPISMAVTKDPAALGLSAVSEPIQPDWVAASGARQTVPWEFVKWAAKGMAIVTTPATSSSDPRYCFVVNIETGAWCKYTGWDMQCATVHNDFVYFGTSAGTVMQAEAGASDDGAIYVARCAFSFDHFGSVGYEKTIHSARATFLASAAFLPQISVSTDYQIEFPTAPNVALITDTPALWDVGVWDVSKWDVGVTQARYQTMWVSVGLTGDAIAPQIQVSCGTTLPPGVELVILDTIFEQGELMI